MSVFQRLQERYLSEGGQRLTSDQLVRQIEERTKEAEQETSARIFRENQMQKIKNATGRSGIGERHRHCTFDNYEISSELQSQVWQQARLYSHATSERAGFIFHGSPGTGKNHLAAAIAKKFILDNKSALIITISELIETINDTYNKRDLSERDLIQRFSQVGLLVLDEVGRNAGVRQERVERERSIIDEIVDRRSKLMKPTGFLTNLSLPAFQNHVGYRVIDRISEDRPIICEFNWTSHRSKL
ncbi:DNA replication protein DnaC [Vibrio chagasii]|uniref:ATP-binding protein n=1 Tax=Vibrio cyclitrophicus TaxID=47951 RepID=UPI000C84188A|nr:ATP-binding protein [Vibrio cyclitrophicus]CAH7222500.1 DNA replication protein DnaC [Vibrio chagasii]